MLNFMMDFPVVAPWTLLHKKKSVCVCWMALCYPSPMWLGHSGCTWLWLVCTLTPTEVWSALWSKGKRQNRSPTHTHTLTHLYLTGHSSQLHTCCWQALTWIPSRFPGGSSESAGIHLRQVTQFTEVFSPFTHPSAHPAFWRDGVWSVWHF